MRRALALLLLAPLAAHAQPAPQRHTPAPPRAHPAPPPRIVQPSPPEQSAPQPPPAPPPTPEQAAALRCRALLDQTPVSPSPQPGIEALDDGGCRFTHVRFGPERFGYEVATLTEHGVPPDLSNPAGKPLDVQIEARTITFSLHSGSARVDWMNRQQQVPFDITFDAAYDPAKHEGTIRKFTLDGAALGHTSLSLVAADLDPSHTASAALRSTQLHMDSRRYFLTFAVPALANFLPEDDPGGAVDRAKANAVAGLRALLPASGASAETVDALAAFVADFPKPQHVLDLDVTADPPLPVLAAIEAMDDPVLLAKLVQTLKVTATYAGDPH